MTPLANYIAQKRAEMGLNDLNAQGVAPVHMVERHPTRVKIEWAIDNAIRQLPFSLAHKVRVVRSSDQAMHGLWFEVVFTDGRILQFDNIDTFPTNADIARIALEAP